MKCPRCGSNNVNEMTTLYMCRMCEYQWHRPQRHETHDGQPCPGTCVIQAGELEDARAELATANECPIVKVGQLTVMQTELKNLRLVRDVAIRQRDGNRLLLCGDLLDALDALKGGSDE